MLNSWHTNYSVVPIRLAMQLANCLLIEQFPVSQQHKLHIGLTYPFSFIVFLKQAVPIRMAMQLVYCLLINQLFVSQQQHKMPYALARMIKDESERVKIIVN